MHSNTEKDRLFYLQNNNNEILIKHIKIKLNKHTVQNSNINKVCHLMLGYTCLLSLHYIWLSVIVHQHT